VESIGGDVFNLERIRQDRCSNQIVGQHAWSYANGADSSFSESDSHNMPTEPRRFRVMVSVQSKRHQKLLRAKMRTWLKFFGPKVVEFDFTIQHRTKSWMSPAMQCAVRITNMRPYDSLIFQACRYVDFERVKMLLDSGEASINDMTEWGGLLYVSIRIKPKRSSMSLTD
jgi:hypothetical protein